MGIKVPHTGSCWVASVGLGCDITSPWSKFPIPLLLFVRPGATACWSPYVPASTLPWLSHSKANTKLYNICFMTLFKYYWIYNSFPPLLSRKVELWASLQLWEPSELDIAQDWRTLSSVDNPVFRKLSPPFFSFFLPLQTFPRGKFGTVTKNFNCKYLQYSPLLI